MAKQWQKNPTGKSGVIEMDSQDAASADARRSMLAMVGVLGWMMTFARHAGMHRMLSRLGWWKPGERIGQGFGEKRRIS
jgi:hypothetical protein